GATLVAPFLGTQDKDRVTFYWRGSASGGSTSDHINLIPATAGKPVRLTVPKQYVTANLNGTVVADYKIERGGETLGHSQELKLRIGVALDLKEPKIKEAPNDTSLDPLNAQNTLTAVIDYDGMLVGDKISVRWTGAPGTLPAGSHTTDPWPVTRVGPQEIPLAVSVIAFNLDKSITLDYAMTRGTQEPKDSQTRTLAVLPIAQSHLPKPLITQASEAGEGSELDVSQLTTNATLRANSYPHIALRQYVWLKAKGTLKGGGVYSKTFWQPPGSQTNATWINQGFYTLAFPLADLQSLEDGHDLELEFKAGFGGTQVESEAVTFALRTYKIKATLDLQPPTLVAPAEDPIDVLAHPEGVTVRIEFRAALSDDQAGLEEVNPPVGSPQFPLVAFNSNKQVDTVLSPAFLAARHDTLVELFWSLYRNNAPAGKSDPVKLRVLKITDGDSRLPSPSITQAPDGKVLDLNEFEGNAEIIVLPWIGISTDNIVQLKLSGKDNNSSDHTIPILTNHKITDTEKTSGIKETLTREQLLTLKHDTEFKALFEVMPSATSNLIPIIFPALNLNLLKPPLVTSEDFETGSVGNKPVGTVMDFPSMTVTVVAGEVIIGVNDSDFTPHITAKYLYIAVGATLRLTLKQPARSIRFGIADSNRIPSQYKCYDENLQLVKAQSTPPYDGQNQVWADITETQNRQIKYIDITDGGGDSYLDNFSIFY
ncbi:hypothetical protein QZR14_27855, partial [Pseudomonas sp. rhizo66]|nr:hypothetical protein [Pseudomonas sp. rhizo66]